MKVITNFDMIDQNNQGNFLYRLIYNMDIFRPPNKQKLQILIEICLCERILQPKYSNMYWEKTIRTIEHVLSFVDNNSTITPHHGPT